MSNDAFEPDAAAVSPGNRSSMDVDITLCENTLYAQSPEPPLVTGSPPPHGVGNAQGIELFCFTAPLTVSSSVANSATASLCIAYRKIKCI